MVSLELLKSLYVINKHAKQYAEQGTENYRKGKKAAAKRNSVRKTALYEVKSDILDDLQNEVEEIILHKINNELYYCFDFGEFTFHSPYNKHNISLDKEVEELPNFDSSSEKDISRSLKESLLYITENTEYNPNDYLTQKRTSYPSGSYFNGWSYL